MIMAMAMAPATRTRPEATMADGSLSLADWRRRVADLYADVRRAGGGPDAWAAWRTGRDALLARHPDTPVPAALREGFTGMRFFDYDPSWRLTGRLESSDAATPAGPEGSFAPLGTVVALRGDREIRLTLLWLEGYGGGLFLPFRDGTCGDETYGGGRYLIDQVKGADLGALPDGQLVLDFNFAYHPSCAHDAKWACPLAPPENTIAQAVRAGEMLPAGR